MEWAVRVKVAAGAARGIAYLHEDCNYRQLTLFIIFKHLHSTCLNLCWIVGLFLVFVPNFVRSS